MVKAKEKVPPTLNELVGYIRRDMRWLDGVADALNNTKIRAGVDGIRLNIKQLLDMVEEVEDGGD